jgi:hypothetical protein
MHTHLKEGIHNYTLCKEPKAVKNFITNIDDTLIFFEFEENLWNFLKFTNPLESYLVEIRRRVFLVDSFGDERSCETLIFAPPKGGIQQPRENGTLIQKKQIYTEIFEKVIFAGLRALQGKSLQDEPRPRGTKLLLFNTRPRRAHLRRAEFWHFFRDQTQFT